VQPWQVFEIGKPFDEPNDSEMQRRAGYVPKTLAKLRGGEPVTIVTWGDSVTAGGDVSSPEKMFAQLFPARLRERFPKSKITHVNAGHRRDEHGRSAAGVAGGSAGAQAGPG
jgi:lysophospholipase L1-like esterase